MTRLSAAGIHLAISLAVALVLAGLFWFIFYPPPLFEAVGGIKIFLMLLGIDVILGPLLTFIVFKVGKKTLKMDLAVIAALQVAAMIYGLSFLWAGRPVFIASLGHRFDLVQAMDLRESKQPLSSFTVSGSGPIVVGTRIADSPAEHERIHTAAIDGIDYGHYPEFHVPIENMAGDILKKASTIAKLKSLNKGREAEIDMRLAQLGSDETHAVYQGLRTRGNDLTVLLDAKTAKVLSIENYRAWE